MEDSYPPDVENQIICKPTFVDGLTLLGENIDPYLQKNNLDFAPNLEAPTNHEDIILSNIYDENDTTRNDSIVSLTDNLADHVLKVVEFVTEPISNYSFQPEFYCDICMENCSTALIFQISNCCDKDNHSFCTPCMRGYYTSTVTEGSIQHFCPGIGCQAAVSSAELKALLDEESFARYERLTQVKQNVMYRECPKCGVGATAPPSASDIPELSCGECGSSYCFYHSDAHVGLSCQQYLRNQSSRTRRELAASHSFVGKSTKKCPSCKSPTEKNGGCNHM